MFGHQGDQQQQQQQEPVQDLLNAPALDGVLSEGSDDFNPALPPADTFTPAPDPTPTPDPTPDPVPDPTPVAPLSDDLISAPAKPAYVPPVDDLVSSVTPPSLDDEPADTTYDAPAPTASSTSVSEDDLLSIKQQALGQLSPLVGQLEQSPEEKFHTTMMMIQANDNKELVQVAYEAAQAITDEKVKAKALLDIVNEINYFTQSDD